MVEGILVSVAILFIIGFAIWWQRGQAQSSDMAQSQGSADATAGTETVAEMASDQHVAEPAETPVAEETPEVHEVVAESSQDSAQEEQPEILVEENSGEMTEDEQQSSVPHTDGETETASDAELAAANDVESEIAVEADAKVEESQPTPTSSDHAEAIEDYVAEQEAQLNAANDSTRPNFELPPSDEDTQSASVADDTKMPGDDAAAAPQEAAKDERIAKLLSRPIPPRRSRTASAAKPVVAPASPVETQGSTIPPRRTAPAAVTPVANLQQINTTPAAQVPTASSDSVESTEVAAELVALQQRSSGLEEEISQLRLQLDASQQELMHLTAARDQALSIVSQNDNQLSQLQTQATDATNAREQIQRERDALLQQLESIKAEREGLQSELSEAKQSIDVAQNASSDATRELEQKHAQTVEELRSALGQREAAEASIARERDALAEQIAELQRRIDSQEENANQASTATDQSDRIADLEKSEHQAKSELSLANETIRQLNQNLSQRDARLMQLQQSQDATQSELTAVKQQLEETSPADDSSAEELAQTNEQLKAAQQELDSTRKQLATVQKQAETIQSQAKSLYLEHKKLQEELTARQNAEDSADAKLQGALSDVEARNEKIIALQTELDELKKKHNHTSITQSES